MSEFTLHERLEKDSFFIKSLDLCQLRLINNHDYMWLILVPQINDIIHVTDLNPEQQLVLFNEINQIAQIVKTCFQPDRLNIASLGNVVSQMHWHIIARYSDDKMWPSPVWGEKFTPYTETGKNNIMHRVLDQLKHYETT